MKILSRFHRPNRARTLRGDLECPECAGEMEIIAFIGNPVVVHTILDHPDMFESSGNDPSRGPPDSDRHYEPVYDDLPPVDRLLPDG